MKTIVSASPKDTEEFILHDSTYILMDDDVIIGFYGLLLNDKVVSLEYLFIEPTYIGKGYGKMLWNHALEEYKN